jgi:ankyrin repeat protein
MSALLAAIKSGDAGRVRTLLDSHPDLVASPGHDGDTPLLLATYYHADKIVRILLERGAPVSLFEAASIGDVQRVRQLLDDQPELIASFSHDGWSPLHLAAHFGHLTVVDLLLARGAEVDARSKNALTNTSLHAALAGGHRATAQRLVEHQADVNAVEAGGYTPLHQAAELGDAEMVRLLLDRGALAAAKADDGRTARDLALVKGHSQLAEELGGRTDASA